MKARQQSGLLSPKCQKRRPAGPLVAATLASSFPLSLWKQTDQKLTCEKIRKLPVLGMTLRVSRVRRLRDGMARACLQDSHPMYTGLLPTHCIQSPHIPLHTRKGVRATKDTLSQPEWSQLYCPYGPLRISKPSMTSVRVSRWDPRGPL